MKILKIVYLNCGERYEDLISQLLKLCVRLVKIDRLQKPVQQCISHHKMASVDFVPGAFLKLSVNSDLSFELKQEQKQLRIVYWKGGMFSL